MGAILLFLKGVPIWLYPVVIAVPMVLYERHEVKVWRDQFTVLKAEHADEKIKALNATLAEDARLITAAKEKSDVQDARLATVAADAALTADAASRLRVELAAVKRRSAPGGRPGTPAECVTAQATSSLLADLYGELARADSERARFAEEAHAAATSCAEQRATLTRP